MIAKLFLTAILVVVILSSGTFLESSAEKFDPLKFIKNPAFEKRGEGNRMRRDITDFQTQIYYETVLDITDRGSCQQFPCTDVKLNLKDGCGSLCSSDYIKYGTIASSLIDCYFGTICGKYDFKSIKLPNAVNISVAAGGYYGQCYLYGDKVTISLANQTNSVYPIGPLTAYFIGEKIYYNFNGLTLYCQPNVPTNPCCGGSGSGSGGGGSGQSGSGPNGACSNCCGSDLLTEVICLVQQLTGSLGLSLDLLSCDCSCGSSLFGRREVRAPTSTPAPFQSAVTITQQEYFYILAVYLQTNDPSLSKTDSYAETTVSFDKNLPTTNANDITNGVRTIFQDYLTYNYIQFNFYTIIGAMLTNLNNNVCKDTIKSCPTQK